MTMPARDRYRYQNRKYRTAGNFTPPFDPREFGLIPHPQSTGHRCEYKIVNGRLFLNRLLICSENDHLPSLNGKRAEECTLPGYEAYRMYRDVGLPLAYTGKIRIGRYYAHRYYRYKEVPFLAFLEVLELVFEDGVLLACNDRSDAAEYLRQRTSGRKTRLRDFLNGS